MAQLAESTSRQYLIVLGEGTVRTILVDEGVDALAIEEVLYLLTILALPLTIGTAPLVIHSDIHRYAPRVVAEIVVAITTRSLTLWALWHTREAGHLHLRTVILALVTIQARLLVDAFVQELATLLGTLVPQVAASVVSPLGPYLVESGNVVAGICEALSPAVGGKGDELGLRVDEVHFSFLLLAVSRWLLAKTTKATTGLRSVFLGLYAVENVLRLGLVVDARVVAPTVGGEDEGGDEVELAIAGSTIAVVCAVRLTTPGKIALAYATLVLHVFLAPAPQTVEDVFLAKLYGHHQTIRHALGTGVVVLDVADVTHGVADLEIYLVGSAEDVVEDFLQLSLYCGRLVAHFHEYVTILACDESALALLC